MADTTHLQLPLLAAAQAQKHVTHNEALLRLDALVQLAVIDRDLTEPPANPSDGDRYIVASGATGAWADWDLSVAWFVDGVWTKLEPREGWRAWIADEDVLVVWDGSAWTAVEGIPESGAEIQNAALIGLGTTADATNPFSAKLNKALWTAKTIAEGGDGDLFYTMNKESAGDDLGFLLQTAFVTKALVGLFGSDIFRVAMSPDGSAFNDALRADTDTGLVTLPSNPKFSAFLNFGQTYTAGAWRDLLFNNTRHNDQLAAAIAGNVLTFTAPAAGTYMFGLGATYEDTGGSAPTKMQVGLSVNGAAPTGDTIGTAGDAAITGGETQAQVTALPQLSQGDEVNPKILFTTNDGRVLPNENFFWGCLVA